MDLVHHVSRGNRRFVLIKNPEQDLRGFIVELVRMTPSAVRGEAMIEMLGVERFLADRVFIPEDRRGLYLNEAQALRFANGRIIRDRDFSEETRLSSTYLIEISDKLKDLEQHFHREFQFRANNPDE